MILKRLAGPDVDAKQHRNEDVWMNSKNPKNSPKANPTTREDQVVSEEDDYLVDFATIPWAFPEVGVRVKQVVRGNYRVRLVEFSEDFVEADWCRKGHIAFVVRGTIEIDFGTRVFTFKAGDGLFIPPDESSKHKARVPNGTATLFIVEKEE